MEPANHVGPPPSCHGQSAQSCSRSGLAAVASAVQRPFGRGCSLGVCVPRMAAAQREGRHDHLSMRRWLRRCESCHAGGVGGELFQVRRAGSPSDKHQPFGVRACRWAKRCSSPCFSSVLSSACSVFSGPGRCGLARDGAGMLHASLDKRVCSLTSNHGSNLTNFPDQA